MALLQRGRFQEQRGFLPPLSIATIIGVLLFGAYIGSAVLSALPFGRRKVEGFKGVGALYTSSDEGNSWSQRSSAGSAIWYSIASYPPPALN